MTIGELLRLLLAGIAGPSEAARAPPARTHAEEVRHQSGPRFEVSADPRDPSDENWARSPRMLDEQIHEALQGGGGVQHQICWDGADIS